MDQEDFQLLISFAIHQKPGAGFAHVLHYVAISLEAKYRKKRNGGIVQRGSRGGRNGFHRADLDQAASIEDTISRGLRTLAWTMAWIPDRKKKCSVPEHSGRSTIPDVG